MHQLKALSCSLALFALAACGRSEAPETRDELQPEPAPVLQSSDLADRTLGPIDYSFDQSQLTLTEVVLPLPPDYEDTVFASKLIPNQRAEMLGMELCNYGESGTTTSCEAEKEAGLALALLERPIDEYRAAFTQSGIGEESLSPSSVDGASGFAFTAQAEGSGTEYRFLSVDGQTLLLAKTFRAGQEQGAAALREVVATLAQGLSENM